MAVDWLGATDWDLDTGPRVAKPYVALREVAVEVVGMTCVISSLVARHEARVS